MDKNERFVFTCAMLGWLCGQIVSYFQGWLSVGSLVSSFVVCVALSYGLAKLLGKMW